MKPFLPFAFFTLLAFSAGSQTNSFIPYEQTIPGSSLKSKMVPIQAGEFIMGSPATEKDRKADEGPQQKIKLSAFWMGAYEVTRDEFDAFYKDETTSENADVDAITRPSPQYVDLSWGMRRRLPGKQYVATGRVDVLPLAVS